MRRRKQKKLVSSAKELDPKTLQRHFNFTLLTDSNAYIEQENNHTNSERLANRNDQVNQIVQDKYII